MLHFVLCNRDIILNLYKLYFPFSQFFFSTKLEFSIHPLFYPPTKHHKGKLNFLFFYFRTFLSHLDYLSSHINILKSNGPLVKESRGVLTF